jgi:2-polyprenyl-6-methoxyphenol hydroxylase-like FAD-dependent oxidoreductase
LIAEIAPFLSDRVDQLRDWKDIKLLSVAVDRLRKWYRSGLLLIGDAAHAMSPIGGVGINLAIQDAVAAANILGPSFGQGTIPVGRLLEVQRRRMFPTRATQRLQVLIQNRILAPTLGNRAPIRSLAWPLKLLNSWPVLRRIPARIVGIGFKPEHVRRAARSQSAPKAMARTQDL